MEVGKQKEINYTWQVLLRLCYLFFRLVEMFHDIVDSISNSLLYFRDTNFCRRHKKKKFAKWSARPTLPIHIQSINSRYLTPYVTLNVSFENLMAHPENTSSSWRVSLLSWLVFSTLYLIVKRNSMLITLENYSQTRLSVATRLSLWHLSWQVFD